MIYRRLEQIGEAEFSQIAELGEKFYHLSGFKGEFRPDTFSETMNYLLKSGTAAMWIAIEENRIVGAIGAVFHNHLFDAKLTVQVCFWLVDALHRRQAGIALFQVFMNWCQEIGADRIMMAHLDLGDGNVGRFYEREGFKKVETIYMRELC